MNFNYRQNWMAFTYLHKPPISEHNSIYFVNNRPPNAQNNDAYCKVSKCTTMNRFVVPYVWQRDRQLDRQWLWGLSACTKFLACCLRRILLVFGSFFSWIFAFPFLFAQFFHKTQNGFCPSNNDMEYLIIIMILLSINKLRGGEQELLATIATTTQESRRSVRRGYRSDFSLALVMRFFWNCPIASVRSKSHV